MFECFPSISPREDSIKDDPKWKQLSTSAPPEPVRLKVSAQEEGQIQYRQFYLD
jgi:hypothetical protein